MCNDRKWLVSGICTFPACVFFSVTLLSSGFRPCPSFCVQPRQTFYIRLLFSDFLFTTLPNYHMIRWSLIWARIVLLFAKHYDIASFANVQDIVVLLLLVSRVRYLWPTTPYKMPCVRVRLHYCCAGGRRTDRKPATPALHCCQHVPF